MDTVTQKPVAFVCKRCFKLNYEQWAVTPAPEGETK